MSICATTIAPRDRRTQERDRIILASRGIPALIPIDHVRTHLQELIGIGMTHNMISRAAGVSRGYPAQILAGKFESITPRYAALLLAVGPAPHPAQEWVLSVGASRRVQALRAFGWDLQPLAAEIGMHPSDIPRIARRPLITYGKWCRIRDTYECLSTIRGGSDRAAAHGHRQGWLLPMEWEGFDIDDPRVVPPRSVRTRVDDRRGRAVDRRERVLELTDAGLSAARIADRLGVAQRTVERDRKAVAA